MAIKACFLMPHPPVLIERVGNGQERVCEKTLEALRELGRKVQTLGPKRIIVISPHGPVFTDAIAIGGDAILQGDLSAFGVPEEGVRKQNDSALVERILRRADLDDIPVVKIDRKSARDYRISSTLDHGVLVPLHFIEKFWTDYSLVHISYGLLSNVTLYRFGMMLEQLLQDESSPTLVIASGDLSHSLKDSGPYQFHPDGPQFDQQLIEDLRIGNFEGLLTQSPQLVRNASECGLRSLAIALGTLDGKVVQSTVHSYEGPFGVGYGVVSIDVEDVGCASRLNSLKILTDNRLKDDRALEGIHVRLARAVIEATARGESVEEIWDNAPTALKTNRAGVFVSIKGPSGLRGCIGTTEPTTDSIGREIFENAIKASTEDPRFPSIHPDELDALTISVDVLMPAEPVESKDLLDPHRYGVIVSSGYRRGLLLPDLEGVDTVDEQLRIALNKAGIRESESYQIERFEVVRHH